MMFYLTTDTESMKEGLWTYEVMSYMSHPEVVGILSKTMQHLTKIGTDVGK